MGRTRVKASTCEVGHRWRGCWDVSVCRRQAGQGPGGAGALGDRWPARDGTHAGVKSALRRPAAALDPGSAAAPVDGAAVGLGRSEMVVTQGFWLEPAGRTGVR